MRVTAGSQDPDNFCAGFVPYTYKGTGFDTLTPHLDEDWERGKGKPMPESKKAKMRGPRKRKPRNPKPKPRSDYYRPRLGDPAHPDHYRYYPEPEPDPFADIFDEVADMPTGDAPEPFKRKPVVRPAPGWTPTTGADIDAWMEEFGA